MKSKSLDKSVTDYVKSLEKVLEKRKMWNESTQAVLKESLSKIILTYDIGWKVQELDWLWNNPSVNLMFETVPGALIEKAEFIEDFEFLKGTALVFSQKYNGDISVLIIYPEVGDSASASEFKELGSYHPKIVDESFVEQKVSDFLEEIMIWEESILKHKVGY